jgi:hypothetical protein
MFVSICLNVSVSEAAAKMVNCPWTAGAVAVAVAALPRDTAVPVETALVAGLLVELEEPQAVSTAIIESKANPTGSSMLRRAGVSLRLVEAGSISACVILGDRFHRGANVMMRTPWQ